MTPHPHAAVLHAIALGGEAQGQDPCWDDDEWVESRNDRNPLTHPGWLWRVKPRTVTRTVTYPAPETVAPAEGVAFYVPSIYGNGESTTLHRWHSPYASYQLWLKAGLVYLRKEDAEARARAMLGEPNA